MASISIGFTVGTAPADIGLLATSLALAFILFACTTRKLASSVLGLRVMNASLVESVLNFNSSGFGFAAISFFASVLLAVRQAILLAYSIVPWLEPKFRFFANYLLLAASMLLLFFLYERRLMVLLSRMPITQRIYGWTLQFLMVFNAVHLVVTTYFFMAAATNTPTGGYASQPNEAWTLRVILFSSDLALSTAIWFGTLHALVAILREQSGLGGSAPPIYGVILGSDCVKFAAVAAIEGYMLAGASDPAGQLGAFTLARTGFPNVLLVVRSMLLTANLFAPVAIATRMSSMVGTASVASAATSIDSKRPSTLPRAP